jgi:hypothetical protein
MVNYFLHFIMRLETAHFLKHYAFFITLKYEVQKPTNATNTPRQNPLVMIAVLSLYLSNSPNMNEHIRQVSPGLVSLERVVHEQCCSGTMDR